MFKTITMKIINFIRRNVLMFRCRLRIFWGFCPQCNSDAPEKDNCKVCDSFYGYAEKEQKTKWLSNYKNNQP